MSRRNASLLLLAAALAVVVLAWGESPRSPALGSADEPLGEEAAVLRTAEGVAAEGPSLQPATRPVRAAEAVTRASVRIRVLGAGGAALPGVYVTLRSTERGATMLGKARATDSRGELVLRDVTHDGTLQVDFFRTNPYVAKNSLVWNSLPPLGGGVSTRVIKGAELVYHARTGLPRRVVVLDAESGTELPGVRIRNAKSRTADADAWHAAPHSWLTAAPIARRRSWAFEVKPLTGWVRWEPQSISATISPYARAIEQIHPLRREIAMTVMVQGADGGPTEAQASSLRVAGKRPAYWSFDCDAAGHMDVHGIPFLREERIRMDVSRKDGGGLTMVNAIVPTHPADRIDLAVTLPDTEPPISLGGGGGSSFRSSSRSARRRSSPRANRLFVTVLRRDGSPAVDAPVSIPGKGLRTDQHGRVTFASVKPGTLYVTVRQPGLLPLRRSVDMPAKGDVRLELRETTGGSITVEIVDGEGRPLSFATLTVKLPSGLPWIDMHGTTQRIDPYTDHLGRRELTHVEPGSMQVSARWGSRKATQGDVLVKDGGRVTVRLVLPRPKSP